jgi:TolB-like protein
MAEERAQRRLAAVLAADVVGYSRLMERDEAGTLAALKHRRKSILEPLVAQHDGRIVKVMGDGVLVEFASAVSAVVCAVELQKQMAAANADLPGEKRIVLRIGINLGDMMVEGGDLYGDGVNVAARLERIAEAGSIVISGSAYDQVKNKIDARFEDLGVQNLKNITEPVRVYRVQPGVQPPIASPAPALPDKPSIAVLPFSNMSGDPEKEHFADGMTEDIITALSRIGELFVISRNSSFVYKGRAHRLESVARELGVRYVLEGSVRAAGNRVRVTAQLIDGLSGSHVWAERYDGSLDDLFAVQDEITRKIALALQVKLTYGELARLWEGQTKDLRAWEKMVAARTLFLQFNIIANHEARRLLEEALLIDPKYTGAMVQLGLTYWVDARFNLAADKEACLRLAEQQAEHALNVDSNMGSAHMLRGMIAFLRDRHDLAIQLLQEAIRLEPGDSWVRAGLALVYVYAGEVEKSLAEIKTAMRFSPHPPAWYLYVLALAHLWSGNLPAAQEAAEADLRLEDDPSAYVNLATVHGFQQRDDDAKRVISEVRRKYPAYGISSVLLSERYKHPGNLHRVVGVLRKAGLPE